MVKYQATKDETKPRLDDEEMASFSNEEFNHYII